MACALKSASAYTPPIAQADQLTGGRTEVDPHEPGVSREAPDRRDRVRVLRLVALELDEPAVGGDPDDVEIAARDAIGLLVTATFVRVRDHRRRHAHQRRGGDGE